MNNTETSALLALPLLCGPAGNIPRGGDMNIDWTCCRAHMLYAQYTWRGNIIDSIARIPRMRSAYRTHNLQRYVIEETMRFNRIVGRILAELPACTHDVADQRAVTLEDALPSCSC